MWVQGKELTMRNQRLLVEDNRKEEHQVFPTNRLPTNHDDDDDDDEHNKNNKFFLTTNEEQIDEHEEV